VRLKRIKVLAGSGAEAPGDGVSEQVVEGDMIETVRTMLTGQLEASLAMLKQCIQACPPEHYEGKIANGSFRTIAYHTLFYVDYYLSPTENAFELRELHRRGGDERLSGVVSPGLAKDDILAYVEICRNKLLETIASETAASLEGPSGFTRLPISRGELHLYNLRHIQHHTGAMSAYLRRVDAQLKDWRELRWVRTGWR
jgi:hypothetical protein